MEINRLEADKHLIGVGRELESLDGKAKATLPVHVTKDGLRFYKPDPEREWERLYDAEQHHLTVGTLQNASELDFSSNNWQFFDGFKAKSLAWYVLREARIAVEEEMENDRTGMA